MTATPAGVSTVVGATKKWPAPRFAQPEPVAPSGDLSEISEATWARLREIRSRFGGLLHGGMVQEYVYPKVPAAPRGTARVADRGDGINRDGDRHERRPAPSPRRGGADSPSTAKGDDHL